MKTAKEFRKSKYGDQRHIFSWQDQELIDEMMEEYASQQEQSEAIDWSKLREMFFEECTEYHSAQHDRRVVNLTPHNLFEWFKTNLTKPCKITNSEAKEKCPQCGSEFIMKHQYDDRYKICMSCKHNWKD